MLGKAKPISETCSVFDLRDVKSACSPDTVIAVACSVLFY